MSWGISKDAVPAGITQVTIYNESTQERVATVFENEAVYLIAAAPELLEAAKQVIASWESGDLAGAVTELSQAIALAENQ